MPKTCIRHKDVASVTMCHQGHVPICAACSIVAPTGTFCSSECSILNREMKAKLHEDKPKGMPRLETMIKLIAAFLLIWLGFYGIHMAAQRVPQLRKIDVVGRIQEALGYYDK